MKKIQSILEHKVVIFIVILFYTVVFPLTVIYVLGAALSPNAVETHTDWYWVVTFSALFSVPFAITLFTENRRDLSNLQSRFLDFVYAFTLLASVNTAVLWFVYPEYQRLEPLTVLLGFIAAWTTYSRNQNPNETTEVKITS